MGELVQAGSKGNMNLHIPTRLPSDTFPARRLLVVGALAPSVPRDSRAQGSLGTEAATATPTTASNGQSSK